METRILENIDKAIQHSMDYENIHNGNNAMLNVINSKDANEFMKLCEKFSEFTKIDALGGNKVDSSWRRTQIDLTFDDVIIHLGDNNLSAGIKTYYSPIGKFREWQEWPDGYIEAFVRYDWINPEYHDIFIWQYIPMKHLRSILEEFKFKLKYYEL